MPGVQAQDQAHVLNETEKRVLESLQQGPLATTQISMALGHSGRSGAVKLALAHLEAIGFIELTIPDKPRSRNQMRKLTSQGRNRLAKQQKQVTETTQLHRNLTS